MGACVGKPVADTAKVLTVGEAVDRAQLSQKQADTKREAVRAKKKAEIDQLELLRPQVDGQVRLLLSPAPCPGGRAIAKAPGMTTHHSGPRQPRHAAPHACDPSIVATVSAQTVVAACAVAAAVLASPQQGSPHLEIHPGSTAPPRKPQPLQHVTSRREGYYRPLAVNLATRSLEQP